MRPSVIAIVLVCGVSLAAQSSSQALQGMVASERAFAAATAEIGVRDGFLTFFADDAIALVPGATGATASVARAKEGLRTRPSPPLPLANRLLWAPFTGHISRDGTLGWLTGAFVNVSATTQEVLRTGAYFSVWKRQPDGTWKVWLDEGVTVPKRWEDAAPFRAAPEPDEGPVGTAAETIADAEQSVMSNSEVWRARLASSARLHREGEMPWTDRAAATAWTSTVFTSMQYHAVATEEARSGDLAVVVGGYDAVRVGGAAEHGTWARVWKRDAAGRWRIVFETSKAA